MKPILHGALPRNHARLFRLKVALIGGVGGAPQKVTAIQVDGARQAFAAGLDLPHDLRDRDRRPEHDVSRFRGGYTVRPTGNDGWLVETGSG